MLSGAISYTLIPLAGLLLGALAAVIRPPGPGAKSAIQHFAAGVVFAAAASEILPGLKHQGAGLPIAVGGGLGVLAMLLVREARPASPRSARWTSWLMASCSGSASWPGSNRGCC